MIAGIGTDIVQIDRICRSLERFGNAFAHRVLTSGEWEQCQQTASRAAFLAKRFAAKEAAAKALGTGIGKVSFKDIEVTRQESGAPALLFHGHAKALQEQRHIHTLHISLTDERDYAVAFVVLEGD